MLRSLARTVVRAASSAAARRAPVARVAARAFSGAGRTASRALLRPLAAVVAATAGVAAVHSVSSERSMTTYKPVLAAASVPYTGVPGTVHERTFVAVKPDGTQRRLVGEVVSRFEKRGYKLVGIKIMRPSLAHAQQHYADLSSKPFFAGLTRYFSSGPVVAMVWEGSGVIKGGRQLVGATNPRDAAPGTFRGDFCIDVGRNVIHASDLPESAQKEIALWFKPEEVCEWDAVDHQWVYE